METKNFSNRISQMGTSIFSVMSKLAIEHHAVNLGQGFPDFDGPEWIMDEAYKAMKEGKNQYAPMNGIISIRRVITDLYKKYYDLKINDDNNVCITAGATEALFSSINALVDVGDEVILFEPFYDAHQADVILAGGIPKYVTLKKTDFSFDFEEFEKEITDKTKLIIVNNPHNPTGKVYSQKELEFISKMAVKYNLYVISDEVYEFLTYDGVKHIPIATLPGMSERTITISSTGKTFSMTGWKIGYAVGCEKMIDAVKKVHQWATFAVNTPAQHAMAKALTRLEPYLPDFKKMYQNKKDLIISHLKATDFKYHEPKGSYFVMVDIPAISGLDDIQMANLLVKDYHVATVPNSVFYGKSEEGKTMLRLCFAKNDNTIIEGINNLKKYKV